MDNCAALLLAVSAGGDRKRDGVSLQMPPLSFLLFTDASQVGWGAHLEGQMVVGVLTEEELYLLYLGDESGVATLGCLQGLDRGGACGLDEQQCHEGGVHQVTGGTLSRVRFDLAQEILT